jgi:dipeptide transport system permease protein
VTKNALTRNARLSIGLGVLVLLVLIALFAPILAPHDPLEQDLLSQNLPPVFMDGNDPAHILGTDSLGRDILSRLIWGTRPALLVMLAGASLSGGLGIAVGLLAGYFGGWMDSIVSRILDIFMSFPPMLVAIVLAAVMRPGLSVVILAVAIIGWTRFTRVIRGELLLIREQDFVTSARILGFNHRRILLHEVLPNVLPIGLALLALEMGRALVVEAVLAFIGFSASDIATWGSVIADSRNYIHEAWWAMVLPILCIVLSVLSLNMLGDGLRRAFDPVLVR